MTKVNLDLEKYLDARRLEINYLTYDYAVSTPLIKEESERVLSTETGPLVYEVDRFDVFDYNSRIYLEDVTKEELENELPDLLTEVRPALTHDVENQDAIFSLVEQLNQRGYKLMGYTQKYLDTWDTMSTLDLVDQIACIPHDDSQYYDVILSNTEEEDEDGRVHIYDEFGNCLLRQSDIKEHMWWSDEPYFDIEDKEGDVVLAKIELENLASVLYSFLKGMSPIEIKETFLFPYELTAAQVNESTFSYTRYSQSIKREITAVEDFESFEDEPVDFELGGFQGQFRCWTLARTFALSRAVTVEDFPSVYGRLILKLALENTGEGARKVGAALIELAAKKGIELTRDERLCTASYRTANRIYEDGKLMNFDYWTSSPGIPLSSSVQIRYTGTIKRTAELAFYELTFSETVAELLDLGQ
ncbi:hypothetical protein [Vagococcus fessus]|uniref:Uncharacterized protein n=1 Tax=Vagococcus fessus TaxID=120370 RepID=A0A430A6G7_9ENTE|nr:hypothetical protein [Vagococcus fessus]RSU02455.1 hypothetical protein CBF31_08785 [Vagococcus fessus]